MEEYKCDNCGKVLQENITMKITKIEKIHVIDL